MIERGAMETCRPGGGCRECKAWDNLEVGLYYHAATCSHSPGYEVARMREAVARAERRAKRDALVKSKKARALRELRTAKRVGE